MHRQVISHVQESRVPSQLMMNWEDKLHYFKHPPFLLLPPALYAEYDDIWCGISLWSFGVICPSCVVSQILMHPQPPHGWDQERKGLDFVQTLLSNN